MTLDKVSSILKVSILQGSKNVSLQEPTCSRNNCSDFDRFLHQLFILITFVTELWLANNTEIDVNVPCSVAYQYSERENTPQWMPMISSVKVIANSLD
jgi:hypothetical protein